MLLAVDQPSLNETLMNKFKHNKHVAQSLALGNKFFSLTEAGDTLKEACQWYCPRQVNSCFKTPSMKPFDPKSC